MRQDNFKTQNSEFKIRIFSGFTLVEILAVIAIMGLLVALSLGSFSIAQKRQRDSQRKADLNFIAQALDLYYGDTRSYPCVNGTGYKSNDPAVIPWLPGLTQVYIPTTRGKGETNQIPRDPFFLDRQKTVLYFYEYTCDTNSYTLTARLENLKDKDVAVVNNVAIYTITSQ